MKKHSSSFCKYVFTSLFYLLISNTLIAQWDEIGSCNIANQLCGFDLTNPIPGLTIGVKNGSNAVVYGVNPNGFKDVQYGLEMQKSCKVSGANDACFTDPSVLKYYVYYPTNYPNYQTCPLLPVIMVHGGSYSDCGDIDNPGIVYMCNEIAKRGFVVFNVEYRRGVLPDRNVVPGFPDLEYISAQQELAVYRGIQDIRGAIRSIVMRERLLATASDYRIDTNNIFIGGVSAGSIIALQTAYQQSQTSQLDVVFPGISTVLGSIDQNYYIGNTTVDIFPKIRGVLNMWGALTIPLNKVNNPANFFLSNISRPPVISFHGDQDHVVWPDTEPLYFSRDIVDPSQFNVNFGRESRCLTNGGTYVLPGDYTTPDLATIGSKSIYTMLKGASIPTELYTDCQMEHGLDCQPGTQGCAAVTFDSEFGTHYTNENDVNSYIAGRAATFFVTVAKYLNNNKFQMSKFVECRNDRHGCTLNANNKLDDLNSCTAYTPATQDDYSCSDILNP